MPPLYPPNFGPGSHGAAVISLQNILYRLQGFKDVTVNGDYDGPTENAVRQLQERMGCKITGYLDPETRAGMMLKFGFNPDGIFSAESADNITHYTVPEKPGEILLWDPD